MSGVYSSIPPSVANNHLDKLHAAENRINRGHDVNEDAWMTTWCQTNWGSLLQPAPLSIALLGSILIVASSVDDFSASQFHITAVPRVLFGVASMIVEKPKDAPDFEWQKIQFPDSFQASLMQMVNEGYNAFETAHKNMLAIQLNSDQIPDVVRNIIGLLVSASSNEVDALFPGMITDLKGLAKTCKESAEGCRQGFHDMANLASELVLACSYKAGNSQQILDQHQMHLSVLENDQKSTQKMLDSTEESLKIAKSAYTDSQELFKESVHAMPSGWELVGMDTVQALTTLAVNAGNAYIQQATMRSKLAMGAAEAVMDKKKTDTSDHKQSDDISTDVDTTTPSSVPSLKASTDPGASQVPLTLTQANALKSLLTGGKDGKADWDKIHSTDTSQRSGGMFVKYTLQVIKGKLEKGKPISDALLKSIDTLLPTVDELLAAARSGGDDAKVAGWVQTANAQVIALEALNQTAVLSTQNTGSTAAGLGTVANPQVSKKQQSAAQIAVSATKFRIDQTKQVLDGARQSYDEINTRLATQQKDMAKTIHEMTSLNLEVVTYKAIIPILKQAVGSFTKLRAQISHLVEFFDSVAALIEHCMAPSVERLVKTLKAAEGFIVGGTTLEDFTRTLIYHQSSLPLRVSMLAQKVSGTYINVSDKYILPPQRRVGEMLKFAKSDDPKDKARLKAALAQEQKKLDKDTKDASDHILLLIQSDQKEYRAAITKRLDDINVVIKDILPDEAPSHLEEVKKRYIKGVVAEADRAADKNPMLKTPDELGLM